jgi:hypothetical protein
MKYWIYLTLTALTIQLALVATQSLGFREYFGHERCITAAMAKKRAQKPPLGKKETNAKDSVKRKPANLNESAVVKKVKPESQSSPSGVPKQQDSEEAASSENKENSPPSKQQTRRSTRNAAIKAAAIKAEAAAIKAAAALEAEAAAAAATTAPSPKKDKAEGEQGREQVDTSNVKSPDPKRNNVYQLNKDESKNCCTKTKHKVKHKATKFKCKASDETNKQVSEVNDDLLKRALADCILSTAIICYCNPSLLPKKHRTPFTKSGNITRERIIEEYKLSGEDLNRFNQFLANQPIRSDGNASDDACDDAAVDRADDEADESAVDSDYVELDEKELDYVPDDLSEDSAHVSDEDIAAKKRHSQESLKVSIFLLSLS